jgi:thymidine phosphorylase
VTATARAGVFFFVVGPSGAGKDTLIDGAKAALAGSERYVFAKRVITRATGAPGEDHTAVSEEDFARLEADGRFLIAWQAHGLRYGLEASLLDALAAGAHVVANGSRAAITELRRLVPRLVVLEVWAPLEILEQRIKARDREQGDAVASRLARAVPRIPEDVEVIRVVNDAEPSLGIERFVAALESVGARLILKRLPIRAGKDRVVYLPSTSTGLRPSDHLGASRLEIGGHGRSIQARLHILDSGVLAPSEAGLSEEAFEALGLPEGSHVLIHRAPAPDSRPDLRAKVAGAELSELQFDGVIGDIVAGRYSEGETAAFLVAATQRLSDREIISLARVRSRHTSALRWDEPIVVDKHSIGGIPGSRITLIVVPIIAAHGLCMPKTSSRAITSAAGTADAMETLARVDLDVDGVRRAVAEARACIAWNGRLNHSRIDDTMNAITRPLALESGRWSVASILSKKLAAGSTHVIVDLPYGPRTKLRTRKEADEIARLFETVGRSLGLHVEAIPTSGAGPIGRGIGPALEVRDVLWTLDGHPDAPPDLREKSLFFAGRILSWDPAVGSEAEGRRRAELLLGSGAARQAFDRIVDAQGRRPEPVRPARLVQIVRAPAAGLLQEVDGWCIAGIARRAGAPFDRGAGVDMLCRPGDEVSAGDPLYAIHASVPSELEAAAALAAVDSGVKIGEAPQVFAAQGAGHLHDASPA